MGTAARAVDAFVEKPLLSGQLTIHLTYFPRILSQMLIMSSWPGLSRPSTSSLDLGKKDVDARHKAGHDEEVKSQPQHGLGADVALDLVGAAVDRDLAVVEVAPRDLRGPVHRL